MSCVFLPKNQVPEISLIQLVAVGGVLAPELGDAHGSWVNYNDQTLFSLSLENCG